MHEFDAAHTVLYEGDREEMKGVTEADWMVEKMRWKLDKDTRIALSHGSLIRMAGHFFQLHVLFSCMPFLRFIGAM